VSKWISTQSPSLPYSYGYERGNVLAIFSSSVVVVLAAMTVVKHSMERLFDPPVIETEGMIFPVCFGVVAHLLATKLVTNKSLTSATEGAKSNFMQNALSDVGYSLCGFSPILGRFLMRRMNPLALLVGVSTCVVLVTKFLVDYEDLYVADIISTFFISALVCGTLLPLSMYCARILLQTTPENLLPLLDKSLKEVRITVLLK
jgi:zinc transporter 6